MARSSIADILSVRFVVGVSTFVTMAVVGVAVAPYIRSTGAPYADLLAIGFGGLVAFLAIVGLCRIYQGAVGDR